MSAEPATLAPRHPGMRAFSHGRRPGFGDCAPSGRMRLDAIAGWLQDVAYADVEDAGLERAAVWVVRRTRIRVNRFPRFGEQFRLTTFCSGLGRMWAERRTDIVVSGDRGWDAAGPGAGSRICDGDGALPDVEAVSLWVHLDAEHWRPTPLTEAELTTYGGAPPHRVSARLRHPAPAAPTGETPWTFRATECDIADHVNNAAYWQPVEEELLGGPDHDPERLDVEIEYRGPTQPGPMRVLREGAYRWIVGADGEARASIRLGPPAPA